MKSRRAQVRSQLRKMRRGEGVDRFDLDDERSIDDEVYSCGSDAGSLEHDVNVSLALETNRTMPKRNAQRLLVRRLQETGPKLTMDCQSGPDHPLRKHIKRMSHAIGVRLKSVPFVVSCFRVSNMA